MKSFRKRTPFTLITAMLLAGCILASSALSGKASAQSSRGASGGVWPEKISSDLKALSRTSLGTERVSIIVQFNEDSKASPASVARMNSGQVRRDFRSLKSTQMELPVGAVEALALNRDVRYISMDRETMSFSGHVAITTGADSVRQQTNPLGSYTLDGSGIGIAILDSGIDPLHVSFTASNGASRIVCSKDFTGENRTTDPYGHGTHVAADAAGNGAISRGKYTGIAPNANIINLRVLNSQGTGSVSSLLQALDWLLANGSAYNVRVANLSLGTPAVDSYLNDPVCRAVRKLVDAGLIVTVASGNNGKDSEGRKLYGHIHSPGNEPSAITVGASNTFGTVSRADDGVATFSSRGPTRSYWTDTNGVRHYDNLIKPDLVAPGNKIISAQSPGNLLITRAPSLYAVTGPDNKRKMMFLSGSSMAAPFVAGAVALMLQANSTLTPNMVKAILMYTAQPLSGFNKLEQGAGQLNIEGAVRLAKLVRTNLNSATPLGTALLTSTTAPLPQTTITSSPTVTTFPWAQGLILDHTSVRGTNLILKYQKIYGIGTLLADGTIVSGGTLLADTRMLSDGTLLADSILVSNGGMLGLGTYFMGVATLLADGTLLSDATLLADGALLSDATLLADTVLLSNAILEAHSAMLGGDNTAFMEIVPDVP